MSGGEATVNPILIAAIIAVIAVVGSVAFVITQRGSTKKSLEIAETKVAEAKRLQDDLDKQADARKREAILEAKDEAYRLRAEIERENRDKRAELQRLERRLAQKEEALDRRLEAADRKERQLQHRDSELEEAHQTATRVIAEQRTELERISGLNQEDAKAIFLKAVEQESRLDAARLIRDIEETARLEGERKARNVISLAIQRCAVDQTSETTVSVVPLPNDEMKGRIIGREGRNIRAFETQSGVDLIIDDTPEAVVLSSYDPIRREIARLALSALIMDGRIHPGRIEETLKKAEAEVEEKILEAGERAVLETGITGIAPEVVRLLGRMRYRTSYGQNVLKHSIEVSHLCGLLAGEIGADVTLAKRAGLLHDLGKAVDHEIEGSHAVIGADILRRHREHPDVIHAVEAHHNDVEPSSVEAVLVICADSISAGRPGARRETLETYVKRLKKLEEIADSFTGVEKAFAVQAGREVRMIVKPDQLDDLGSIKLAREIARRIEDEMEYPGQIKVTVIRETRAVEFAK
jgi:ribonuclease Y